MKRVVAVLGLVVLAITVLFLAPPRLRLWNCHNADGGSTPRAALNAYYASCWSRPTQVEGPYDGGTGTRGYEAWHWLDEFTVVYRSHKTRFVLVGQRKAGGGWRVLDGEGTGP